MAKYLIKASYNAEGTKGLLKDGGSNRRDAAAKVIEDMGGTVETGYRIAIDCAREQGLNLPMIEG